MLHKSFFFILLSLALTVCGGRSTTPASSPVSSPVSTSVEQLSELENVNVIIREDEDKLVQVHIVNGKAEITFDLAQWDELHEIFSSGRFELPTGDLKYFDKNTKRYGPFPVHGQTGRVKDACVGYVQRWINGYGWDDDLKPTVVFLMEDGNLEYIEADPFWLRDGNDFMFWELPWLDSVWSFEYGETGEVRVRPYAPIADEDYEIQPGDITEIKSIFAVDGNGMRHDIKKLIDYRFLLCNGWICTFYPSTGGKFIHGVIRFEQDGTVRYEEGEGVETIDVYHEIWHGRYYFVPEEEYAKVVVDLQIIWQREWWGYDHFGYPESKAGEYRVIPGSHWLVDFELLDGDALHINQETRRPFTLYEFQTLQDDGYGNELLGKIKGFRDFLDTAEKPKLEELVMQNPVYFYNILPFTYVLDVSDK